MTYWNTEDVFSNFEERMKAEFHYVKLMKYNLACILRSELSLNFITSSHKKLMMYY